MLNTKHRVKKMEITSFFFTKTVSWLLNMNDLSELELPQISGRNLH